MITDERHYNALKSLAVKLRDIILEDAPTEKRAEAAPIIDDALTVVAAFFLDVRRIANTLERIAAKGETPENPDQGKLPL